jgi:hypothetical protein
MQIKFKTAHGVEVVTDVLSIAVMTNGNIPIATFRDTKIGITNARPGEAMFSEHCRDLCLVFPSKVINYEVQ